MTNSVALPVYYENSNKVNSLIEDILSNFWSDPGFQMERNWRPIEVSSEKDAYVIEIELPRFKKEDIKIEVFDTSLSLSAKNSRSSFKKTFSFDGVDFQNTTTKLEDGVLTIKVPKVVPKSKLIQIS